MPELNGIRPPDAHHVIPEKNTSLKSGFRSMRRLFSLILKRAAIDEGHYHVSNGDPSALGGATIFVNMYPSYEALSQRIRMGSTIPAASLTEALHNQDVVAKCHRSPESRPPPTPLLFLSGPHSFLI
jgi:hypothetical protein